MKIVLVSPLLSCLRENSTADEIKQRGVKEKVLTTLCGNDTALSESIMKKLEIRLLEQALCWALWVGAVGDDDIELALLLCKEFEAIANVGLDLGVLITDSHAGKVLLTETNDSLINVAEDGFLNTLVFDDLTENTTVTTTNDKNLLGAGVGVHGEMSDHLLVGELVAFGALNDVVENEDHAVVGGLKDKHILVLGLFVMNDLVNLEGHGLARPHVGDLTEPAIYRT